MWVDELQTNLAHCKGTSWSWVGHLGQGLPLGTILSIVLGWAPIGFAVMATPRPSQWLSILLWSYLIFVRYSYGTPYVPCHISHVLKEQSSNTSECECSHAGRDMWRGSHPPIYEKYSFDTSRKAETVVEKLPFLCICIPYLYMYVKKTTFDFSSSQKKRHTSPQSPSSI